MANGNKGIWGRRIEKKAEMYRCPQCKRLCCTLKCPNCGCKVKKIKIIKW